MMALSGVRISWLMFARNADFARLAVSASCSARCANCDLDLQRLVGREQLGGPFPDARLEIVARRPQLLLRTHAFTNLRRELGGRFPDALLRRRKAATVTPEVCRRGGP